MGISTRFIVLVLIAGCAPAQGFAGEPAADPVSSAAEEESRPLQRASPGADVARLTVRDLALRLGRETRDIEVVAVERVDWPDSGLGCPLPGAVYAPAVTPGYRIRLDAAGEAYTYHTDTGHAFVWCRDGSPELPVIPVDPDQIKDGTPWMPVDPPPAASEGGTIAEPDSDR